VRVFFDTNVIASAFTSQQGLCFKLLEELYQCGEFITGEVVLTELQRILPEKFHIEPDVVNELLNELRNSEIVPSPSHPSPIHIRDPDDGFVLESALIAKADILVTGDQDLLELGDKAGIRIMDPRTLWEILSNEKK